MKLIYAAAGAILGGITLQFGGAVAGGIIGLLASCFFNLQSRLDRLEREVAWLRSRYAENRRSEEAGAPVTSPHQPPNRVKAAEPTDICNEIDTKPSASTRLIGPPPVTEKPCPDSHHDYTPHSDDSSLEIPFAEQIRKFFSGENLLVKLGVVVLIFGVSFLVKYAAQRGLFPIELRLTTAALGGCALLAFGWRVRSKRPVYAQVIQGGGISILYLTIYAAMRLYHLVPTMAGFALLIAICALSATLSVLQDSRSLAIMGSAGGFLAPELASIGSGSPAMLFSYYAILNIGILAIARLRAWRELNLLGFVSTFIISALWGGRFYTPHYFMTVEPFLTAFFLMYAMLPVLYARQRSTALDGYVDVTLVFGTPVMVFAFQAALVRDYEYGLAWSALAAGIFYIVTASRLFRREPELMRSLAESFLALGTVFCTLAIPLAFDGRWTSAAWSIEGAALVWIGLRQDRRLARLFGYLLLIASGIVFIADSAQATGPWPVMNSFYIGCVLVCGGALFSSWQLSLKRGRLSSEEWYAEQLLFAWGMLWWYASGLHEIGEYTLKTHVIGAALVFTSSSSLACNYLLKRIDWQLLEYPALGLLPAMAVISVLQLIWADSYPSLHGGWFGWPLAVACWYVILWASEQRRPRLHAISHFAALWLATLLIAWEAYGRISSHLPKMETWGICAGMIVPAIVVLLIARRGNDFPWPVKGQYIAYLGWGALPLALIAWIWLLWANLTTSGTPWPLPFVPVINPLDGASILVLITLACYWRTIRSRLPELAAYVPERETGISLALTAFIWLNALLLRTIHHWSDVPFTAADLFESLTVQASLSIFWSLLALVVMTVATRQGSRQVWLAGAVLLGTVVIKLFLIDLAGHGSVARIISFVSVGVLLLVIGWFAPVPPRSIEGAAS